MGEYTEQHRKNCDILMGLTNSLNSLAESFHRTGNISVANEIFTASDLIYENVEEIRYSMSEILNESFKTSQQITKTVLESVLASNHLKRKAD